MLLKERFKNKWYSYMVIICLLIILILPKLSLPSAKASSKNYGILIADEKGKYTFYDLKHSEGAGIEISENGNIMVPLKRLCNLMPHILYTYDRVNKQATVENTRNGRKVVFTRDSSDCYYYPRADSKGKVKTMPYQMYVSKISASVMVHMSALKWVMGTSYGYQYYRINDMQLAGYDTFDYHGLIAYHPYEEMKELPMATSVKGLLNTIRVTVPEGFSVVQIFDLLVKKGVCSSVEELFEVMESYDYSYYPLIHEIPDNENRCFRLEGYLFPDTYEFYRLSKPQDVIGKFLRNTELKITQEERWRAQELGYTIEEVLTIASLIEKEVGDPAVMPYVSSVIHNRLNKPMKLQLDASYFYIERYIKPNISGELDRYSKYYDTYKCSALPPGPICNPSKNAIQAALYPAETDYFFFYSDKDGVYHFSNTYVKLVKE